MQDEDESLLEIIASVKWRVIATEPNELHYMILIVSLHKSL